MRRLLPSRVRAAVAAAALLSVVAACSGGGSDAEPPASATPAPTSGVANPSDPTQAEPEALFFSADSPWNQRIDTSTVDVRSAEMLDLAKERVGVAEDSDSGTLVTDRRVTNEGIFINTTAWTTPIVTGGVPTKLVCRQIDCGDKAPGDTLQIPADVSPDPRYDGWFTVIDSNGKYAYDLWRARREEDGTISYNFLRRWALDGNGYNKAQTVAGRGSGLPLFAGLIRPGELQAGQIDHALAISVPGPAAGVFVQPASVTDGNGRENSLPEGARIRLKADVQLRAAIDADTGKPRTLTAQQQRVGDAIVAALRTYGAIVVDRAAVPTLYAQRDVTTGLMSGNELQGLTLDDFEVITLGELIKDAPDGTATNATSEGTVNQ